jgi:SIR2-like domain
MKNPDAFTGVARSVLDGSAMLFVGAGLSFLTKNAAGDSLPNGDQLKAYLHSETGTKKSYPLEKISNYYVRKFGPAKLYDYLTQQLSVASVDKRLTELYKLPWRRIYTTNYDDAIEIARKSSRDSATFTLSESAKSIPDGAVVHINGFIERVSPQSISDDLKLTDYSYATSNFVANKEWSQFFLNDLRVSRAIIFAGYSLADLDIARILIAESALNAKTLFFIAPDSDEVEVASLVPYGVIVSEGVEKLFDIMKAEQKTYEKPTISEIFYSISNFGKVVKGTTSKSAAVKVHEQLVYGTVLLPELMSAEKVFGDVPFNIPRDQVQHQISRIIRGDVRDIAIIGDLASGKTFAALQVAQALLSAAYRVYWVLDGRKLRSDLNRLVRIAEKTCLIVDGYSTYLDEVRDYLRQRPNNHILVATERSATHELLWPQLGRTCWQRMCQK